MFAFTLIFLILFFFWSLVICFLLLAVCVFSFRSTLRGLFNFYFLFWFPFS